MPTRANRAKDPTEPKNENGVREISLYYDPGNREQIANIGGQVVRYPSIFHHTGFEIPYRNYPNTAFVSIQGNERHLGTYVVGLGAISFPETSSIFEQDLRPGQGKISMSLPFLLAFVQLTDQEIHQGKANLEIVSLWVTHPSPNPQVVEGYAQELCGTHEFTLNGVDVTLVVSRNALHVLPEAEPAYYLAVEKGFLPQPENGEVAFVCDLGGLTQIIQGFNQYGPLPDGRTVIARGGVIDLASRIATPLKETIPGEDPSLRLIMEGLKKATLAKREKPDITPSYIYGTRIDFSDLVPTAKKAWAKVVSTHLVNAMKPYLDMFVGCAFIGGGANYSQPTVGILNKNIGEAYGGQFSILQGEDFNPEEANVLGLQIMDNKGLSGMRPLRNNPKVTPIETAKEAI